ncbi:LPS assembly protein LptD [Alphaproteobacteria bacterium]|nr:LPS assembly protein LptD [Alphaproteobacteria bacterium]
MKIIILILSLFLFSVPSYSKENAEKNVEFTSDSVEVDEKKNLMIARGNVIIKSEKETIKADSVKYDKVLDKATASGNIIIINNDGTIIETSEITLTNEFKNILALTLFSKFKDNSKLKASKLSKTSDISIFFNGEYTPCDCDFKNGEKPVWQLNSSKITYDKLNKMIYFKNVILKIMDYPFFYFPYLSTPDPSVRRKSGFLQPTIGYTSRNGLETTIPYYFTTENESWDSTFTNHYKGKNGYINQLNVRKKYLSGYLETNLFQGQVDTNKENDDEVFAGNLNFEGQLEGNWNIKALGKYTDQDTFMRRYNFDNSSNYKNYIRANKFTNNVFSEIEWYKYTNLNVNKKDNQPNLQPSIKHKIFSNDKNINSEISLNAHEIKDDEGYDIQRWSGSGILDYKVNNKFIDLILSTETGLDLYAIKNRPSSDTNDNKYLDRLSLGISVLSKKDFILNIGKYDLLMTPKVQIVSMHSTDRKNTIPNRDSSDFRIDQANLFLINQYQGRDNIQTNQRLNFGVDNDLDTDIGTFSLFLGQSQKIGGTNKNIIDTNSSRQSDFITEMQWMNSKEFNLSYNALFDHHNLETNYSSVELSGEYSNFNYTLIHRSLNQNLISDNSDREEIQFSIGKKIDNWKLSYTNKYDLNNNDVELIEEQILLDYVGEFMFQDCLSVKLIYKNKDGLPDRDILPENSIFLTLSFKNLGDYGLNSLF